MVSDASSKVNTMMWRGCLGEAPRVRAWRRWNRKTPSGTPSQGEGAAVICTSWSARLRHACVAERRVPTLQVCAAPSPQPSPALRERERGGAMPSPAPQCARRFP